VKRIHDIAIVGAGPVGSYTAYQFADKGYSVSLFDAKKKIGKDVICAGVIGKTAFQKYDLPAESILNRINIVQLISPSGQRLEYSPKEVFAYVVDRDRFDQGLFLQAKRSGVDAYLGRKINKLTRHAEFWELNCGRSVYRAKYVILATGVNFDLHSRAGLSKAKRFLYGSQIELPGVHPDNIVHIHMNRAFAPGSFGWVVPAGDTVRTGLILPRQGKIYLKRMLNHLKLSSSGIEQAIKIKPIVYGPVARSAGDRIIALGEAAGQIKTTTGGGISYGLLSSEIAVEKIEKSLKGNCDLNDYDLSWRSALASEFDIGYRVRNIASKVSDKDIEKLFSFVKKHRFWVDLLVPRIDFDFHSNFIFFCIKSFGSLLKITS
jgi:geranylgeranyl reductase family protein